MRPLESSTMLGYEGVHVVNPLELADWDHRIAGFPDATFFHGAAWARVLHSTYGYQPYYFTEGEPDGLHSVLPFMEVNSWLTGRRGVSLPFTDALKPLGRDAGSFQRLFSAAKDQAKVRGWNYLECRGGREWLGDAPASTSFLHHALDLQPDAEALFNRFDDAARRAVRKAERGGLNVEFSQSPEAIRTFHGLLCETRKRHGVPPQPFPFFANIHRHVLAQNQGWVVLARQGTVPVAGAVFFHFGRNVIYKFGASAGAFQHVRANNLVMWQAIQWYARQGFATFDFGRTSLGNDGLRRFKLGWGAREERIEYFRYDRRAGGFVTAKDESTGWHTRVFHVLPVFLSRPIGAMLYPHLG